MTLRVKLLGLSLERVTQLRVRLLEMAKFSAKGADYVLRCGFCRLWWYLLTLAQNEPSQIGVDGDVYAASDENSFSSPK